MPSFFAQNYQFQIDEVIIGSQIWSSENLAIDDGGVGIGYPDEDSYNVADFGLLYTKAAATRVVSAIGNDWRLPSTTDWEVIIDLDLPSSNADKFKEDDSDYWDTGYTATNDYLFNGRGAGRYSSSISQFKLIGIFWASNQITGQDKAKGLVYNSNTWQDYSTSDTTLKYSIRLVKDV